MNPDHNDETFAICPQCKEDILVHSDKGGTNHNVKYAWFDSEESTPCCCEGCRDNFVEEFGWEYEDEEQKLFDITMLQLNAALKRGDANV